MSVTIEVIINCDKCGEAYCEADQRYEPAYKQRASFSDWGWIHKNGKDICDTC